MMNIGEKNFIRAKENTLIKAI